MLLDMIKGKINLFKFTQQRRVKMKLFNLIVLFSIAILVVGCHEPNSPTSVDNNTTTPAINNNNFSLALSSSLPPGQNFNLSTYKLQTPVASGSGVLEISQPQLATFTASYFYTGSDGAMTFWCPVTGATTSGSSYPRSELRQLTEFKPTGTHILSGTVKILQQPSTGKIIFAQIHGSLSGSEMLKLRWTNGSIRVGTKTTIISSIAIGTTINYTIKLVGTQLTVTVNGSTYSKTYGTGWDKDNLYFKAGSYIEDNSGTSTEGGKVAYYALSNS
jgi:hypothetical protein